MNEWQPAKSWFFYCVYLVTNVKIQYFVHVWIWNLFRFAMSMAWNMKSLDCFDVPREFLMHIPCVFSVFYAIVFGYLLFFFPFVSPLWFHRRWIISCTRVLWKWYSTHYLFNPISCVKYVMYGGLFSVER